MTKKNFYLYSRATLAALKSLNLDCAGYPLVLGFDKAAGLHLLMIERAADGKVLHTQRFASEDQLRAELARRQGSQADTQAAEPACDAPQPVGRPAKPVSEVLKVFPVRLNERQRHAVASRGHQWLRDLIDAAPAP